MDFGPSSYDGGPGNDELSFSSQGADGWGEIHALGGGDATIVRSFSVSDSAQGVETFEGFDGPTKFYGGAEADHFIGTKYNDWFLPLGGDDIIDGGPSFLGTTGQFDVDVLSVGASTAAETVDMSEQTATGEGMDTFQDIEALQASPQDDVFEGNPGRAGLLQIDGNGGHDVLDLSAVLKPQTVFVGTRMPPGWLWATAIAKVIGTKRADTVTFSGGDTRARFLGGDGNDTLVGGRLNDVLVGGAGDDTIDGKGGTDTCDGGPGVDAITNCERS
jgi:Ca2+-binding RTX toxin-like protein